MHAKSQPRYLDLPPDSNCKVRRVWNFWASRLQRWYNDTSWRTSWNSQVVTNRDIVAGSVDHPADNRWQGGGRHTMRLTRKWLGFVTHQTQICHHMLGFVGQQTQICRSIHQLLVTAHRLAGGPVSLWASSTCQVHTHMCATLYAELGLVFRETSESGFLQGVNIEQGRGWEDRTPS